MSSKIEREIDEIEEYIDSCKSKFLSNTEIIVNKDEMDEHLRTLRKNIPDEIRFYQDIISRRDEILNEAQNTANSLVNEAAAKTTVLINEHEIMRQAYEQANEVVTLASRQAQEILDNATMEANDLKTAAMQYMDDMLANLEDIISSASQSANANYNQLIGSLSQYLEVIQANRRELHPVTEIMEDVLDVPDIDKTTDNNLQ